MRVLVIGNGNDCDAGYVGEALLARGGELVVAHRDAPDGAPLVDDGEAGSLARAGIDVVVSLGSEWSVYWPQVSPAVDRESAVLREGVEAGLPVLGLCFGGQLLAHALGGSVEPTPTPEVGFFSVDTDDPTLVPAGPYVQWHSDRFVVPAGARELARSAAGPQAYVVGTALGLQFHPEATPDVVRRWCAGGAAELARLGADGLDGPAFVAEAERQDAEARARAALLVDTLLTGVPATAGTS